MQNKNIWIIRMSSMLSCSWSHDFARWYVDQNGYITWCHAYIFALCNSSFFEFHIRHHQPAVYIILSAVNKYFTDIVLRIVSFTIIMKLLLFFSRKLALYTRFHSDNHYSGIYPSCKLQDKHKSDDTAWGQLITLPNTLDYKCVIQKWQYALP